jgi:hypothetical protein
MANGAHALTLLAPELTAASPSELEIEIGAATAAAVIAIAMGIDDYAAGGAMTPATKIWASAMLGRVAELHLAHPGDPQDDFSVIVHREGKRALQRHPAGIFLARLGKEQVDAVIDELIGHVLVISARVVADELALRTN